MKRNWLVSVSGVFYVLLFALETLLAALSLACATAAVCLFGGLNIYALIPPMPYWCGAVFGLSLAALAILSAAGCIYFAACIRQLYTPFSRSHHNAIATPSGSLVLPSPAIPPQLSATANRRIRTAVLLSLIIFVACFVPGIMACMLSSGALGFWHAWGWFAQ